jgi:eukaryotic-like serine/threonine-protein kinase
MTLSPGQRLGAYEIVALVSAGGMGEIYRARDTRLDRTVAIKILSASLAADPDLRHRFEREARAISSLNHPHICTLFDVGQQMASSTWCWSISKGRALPNAWRASAHSRRTRR